jgi:hypothetical protein
MKHYTMEAYEEWMYRSTFSLPHSIGGSVDPRSDLEDVEKRKYLPPP